VPTVAKRKSSVDPLLEGLKTAVDRLPELLPLIGTKGKGLFTKANQEAADRAIAEGYLTTREVAAPSEKGKNKAVLVVYAIITEPGARRVAEASGTQDVKTILESLRGVVEKLGTPPAQRDTTAIRTAIENATATCVNAINAAFGSLRGEVLAALSDGRQSSTDPAPILAALRVALSKVEPTIVKVPVIGEQSTLTPLLPTKPETGIAVANEIVAFVADWTREKTVGPPFDVIMKHLRVRHPHITIGEFHDALRRLTGAHTPRLKFSGWSKTIHELPDPELALFAKHTVMYYAHLSQ
jgi:hypothetical protein